MYILIVTYLPQVHVTMANTNTTTTHMCVYVLCIPSFVMWFTNYIEMFLTIFYMLMNRPKDLFSSTCKARGDHIDPSRYLYLLLFLIKRTSETHGVTRDVVH